MSAGPWRPRRCATRWRPTDVQYFEAAGEAAFYGPKADFLTRDVLGREWQISTIQVDFIQPQRLGCQYIGEDSQPHTPSSSTAPSPARPSVPGRS